MIAVVEDGLSEAVVRKTVAEVRPDMTIYQVMRKNGQGYIRTKIRELNRVAHRIPVFVLVDLDRPEPCPADLIRNLLPIPQGPMLLFRVAVMEIESWVLADRRGFSKFLGIPHDSVPDHPDAVADPKELIVSLARKSKRREIREDMIPSAGDVRRTGAAFNPRLIAFVENDWSIQEAAAASPSLRKTIERLRTTF